MSDRHPACGYGTYSAGPGWPRFRSGVHRRLREQQTASEVLVGLIQLGVVLFLGLLYALSPKTFVAGAMIEPVPWALGGYLGFTVIRLLAAWRRPLRVWLSVLSCVVDIGLLLLLIWSFHIQYAQPAAFVLKTPTLFYVFIFIALRALLLDPRLVVLTGLAAAGGWLLIVAAVILSDQRPGLVTRNYVEYLTSNRLLVGAELDKVVAILLVTGLVALAVLRARSLLIRSVAGEVRARDLARFFSPEVAERITAGELELVPGHGEGREAAILYLDIRNFTTMAAAMTPDELIALLAEYQARLVPPILTQGDSEKYGDGMVGVGAVVGARVAADASRCRRIWAWPTHGIVSAWPRAGSRSRCGWHAAGPSWLARAEARLEFAVVGHPVNLAAKLEKHAKIEEARAVHRDTLNEPWPRATSRLARPNRGPPEWSPG